MTTDTDSQATPRPLLHDKRIALDSRQAAQYQGTRTELDNKPSDRDGKANIRPVRWA